MVGISADAARPPSPRLTNLLCKNQQVVVLRCVLYNIVPVCVSPMPYPGSGPYVRVSVCPVCPWCVPAPPGVFFSGTVYGTSPQSDVLNSARFRVAYDEPPTERPKTQHNAASHDHLCLV